jgi:hypothetical protein
MEKFAPSVSGRGEGSGQTESVSLRCHRNYRIYFANEKDEGSEKSVKLLMLLLFAARLT